MPTLPHIAKTRLADSYVSPTAAILHNSSHGSIANSINTTASQRFYTPNRTGARRGSIKLQRAKPIDTETAAKNGDRSSSAAGTTPTLGGQPENGGGANKRTILLKLRCQGAGRKVEDETDSSPQDLTLVMKGIARVPVINLKGIRTLVG